jgi:hypothetical protein
MKKKFLISSVLLVCFLSLSIKNGNAQSNSKNPPTNPTPIKLTKQGYTQDFEEIQKTYPDGWNGWLVKPAAQTGAYSQNNPRLDAPYSNTIDAIQKGSAASKGNFIFNFGGKLGFKNGGYSDYAIVTALNTIETRKAEAIKVSFDAMIMRNLYEPVEGMNLVCALALQYRIGEEGKFITLADEIIKNGKNQNTSGTKPADQKIFSIDLPKECLNQSIVQLRWIMKYISGSIDDVNNRPSFAIDNFVVEVK